MLTGRTRELFSRWLDRSVRGTELSELMHGLAGLSEVDLSALLEESFRGFAAGGPVFSEAQTSAMLQEIREATGRSEDGATKFIRRIPWWKPAAVAAAVVIGISFAGWLYFVPKHTKPVEIQQTAKTDIAAPQITKATVTLAGGRRIFLDSVNQGTLAMQGNIKVVKNESNRISYLASATGAPSVGLGYNILTNPRGSKVIDITLSDGSRVWLNAESSLRYPVAFNGNERKVEIAGEAYFEVTHDQSKPFKVSKGNAEVEVLGTHFNINAYEENIKVTLLEGSVKLSVNQHSAVLIPGQQAFVDREIMIRKNIDADEILAWKNNLFDFRRKTVREIMAEIVRWYDVDVSYEGTLREQHYSGIVSRSSNVSQVLKIMEQAGVGFRIEGNKIIVTP